MGAILRDDIDRTHLVLTLAHLEEVGDDHMAALARGIPVNLQNLVLSFEGCSLITDKGIRYLAQAFPPSLQVLNLDFLGCKRLSDSSVRHIARNVPPGLRELTAHFSMCPMITPAVLPDLALLPKSLRHVELTFKGTQLNRDFHSLDDLCNRGSSLSLGGSKLIRRLHWGRGDN